MSLEQVLSGAPENTEPDPQPDPAPAPAPDPAPQPDPSPEQGEQPAATPAAKPEKMVPLAALEDERRKRQELEQRLQPKQEKPGFWEQPEQHLAELRHFAATQALSMKLDISESIAKDRHEDYDAQLEVFGKLVEANPHLRVQMLQARNPAEFAYSTAKNHKAMEEAGSIEGMREKIRAEERAKIEAEFKAKADADARRREALPETLTDAPSAPAPKAGEFLGPTPLGDILK